MAHSFSDLPSSETEQQPLTKTLLAGWPHDAPPSTDELQLDKTIHASVSSASQQDQTKDTAPVFIPKPHTTRKEMPRLDNKPEAILSAWSALEVLSPPSFRRPEDLANGHRSHVVKINDRIMPWESGRVTRRENQNLYYHVVLGSINMQKAVSDLMDIYADERAEKPFASGESILASITVDEHGLLTHGRVTSVSSFGWGLTKALKGDLKNLANWPAEERTLNQKLHDVLSRIYDGEEERLPLNQDVIQAAYTWLIQALQIPTHLLHPPTFAIKVYQHVSREEPPESLILNSFFLNDLVKARLLFEQDKAPTNLKRYLGVLKPQARQDLLADPKALASAVAPRQFPLSCWPAPGHHALVLLQQAAVNLAMNDLHDTGMLAVNGPPGTGKTTLLRDMIAEIVTKRAQAMVEFADPNDAFTQTDKKIKVGTTWLHLHQIDDTLRGFEILIASSSNKAVENISAELPGVDAIAPDIDLNYFKIISDRLTGKDSWGLIAAVLGNAGNRFRFKEKFWWDDDYGLSRYLAAASGSPQLIQDRKTQVWRTPHIIEQENPPRNLQQALTNWETASQDFKDAVAHSQQALQTLEDVRQMTLKLSTLQEERMSLQYMIEDQKNQLLRHQAQQQIIKVKYDQIFQDAQTAQKDLEDHFAQKPTIWNRFFNRSVYLHWKEGSLEKKTILVCHRKILKDVAQSIQSAQAMMDKLLHSLDQKQGQLSSIQKYIQSIEQVIATHRDRLGHTLVDDDWMTHSHEEKHSSPPWFDRATHQVRERVFVAAIKTHRAFIDASAKKIRPNLGALMSAWKEGSLLDHNDLLPDLWTTLFLVVPSVSTTFSSIERMLGQLPPQAFGWLLIDEAGQALPQAAVGAIMRTQKAVVVGDPLQIEPVVVMPEELTRSICGQFGIDPDTFNAPVASIQTLADKATPYMTQLTNQQASRTVGVPSLVHRRCENPMFGISNTIAYGNLMIRKKTSKQSQIRDFLGPTRWFDVQGSVEDKWCPEEGGLVLDLLQQLKYAKIVPDLYIITPFVMVQDHLRRMIRESELLEKWVHPGWINDRIGTVHTVQGREAEAVMLVLGAPDADQKGARYWAGDRPNLLNVAVTRAKEVLYVIGHKELWQHVGVFSVLNDKVH